jgi:chaperonin GroEL
LDGSVVVANIRRSKEKSYGYDVEKGEYTDLRKRGIVDPVKVTRTALQNGASVACLLLTTESMVADIPEKKKETGPPDHHGGGMGGMGDMGMM